nr:hypothetical protein [Tanacetum cinerariifolium]
MTAQAVAGNGHPKMIGTDASSSISKITKSTGFSYEMPNVRKKEYGIRLMLAPKSAKAFFTGIVPIRYGNVKLLGSPFFWELKDLVSNSVRSCGNNLSKNFKTICSQLVIIPGERMIGFRKLDALGEECSEGSWLEDLIWRVVLLFLCISLSGSSNGLIRFLMVLRVMVKQQGARQEKVLNGSLVIVFRRNRRVIIFGLPEVINAIKSLKGPKSVNYFRSCGGFVLLFEAGFKEAIKITHAANIAVARKHANGDVNFVSEKKFLEVK